MYKYILENIYGNITSNVPNSNNTTVNNSKYNLFFGSFTQTYSYSVSTASGIKPISNILDIIEKTFTFFNT